MNNQYDEKSIQVLSPVEHVRRRPGMYIGGVDKKALHNLLFEVIKSMLTAKEINICLLDEGVFTIHGHEWVISVNGYGEPSSLHQGLTSPYKGNFPFYGLFPANALSEWCLAEIRHEGYLWQQKYEMGKEVTELVQLRPLTQEDTIGTTLTFKFSFTVLEPNEFDYDVISRRLHELVALNAGLKISLRDERTAFQKQEKTFVYENGVAGFVEYLNRDTYPLHTPIHAVAEFAIGRGSERIRVEIAFQYVDSTETIQLSYGETILTTGHGTHQNGFMNALLHMLSVQTSFTVGDITSGLTSIVSVQSVQHPIILFDSQTNPALINEDIEQPVFDLTVYAIARFAERHPDQMQRIIEKCLANKRAREA